MKLALIFFVCVISTLARGATFKVDDSLTMARESSLAMEWAHPTRANAHSLVGKTFVTVRLRTAPFLNRIGRVYLVLPPQPGAAVQASWTTQGRLIPGQVVSGSRAMVYAGILSTPLLEDTIVLTISTDGRYLSSVQHLNFHFELDID